jgi:hypothetical protein
MFSNPAFQARAGVCGPIPGEIHLNDKIIRPQGASWFRAARMEHRMQMEYTKV